MNSPAVVTRGTNKANIKLLGKLYAIPAIIKKMVDTLPIGRLCENGSLIRYFAFPSGSAEAQLKKRLI